MELTKDFFKYDALKVAKELLGKKLVFRNCSGIIVETEAYKDDEASHAHKKTPRSKPLIQNYGTVYIYLNYGMYHMLNFTCDKKKPGGVLIRAIEPTSGINLMKKRRNSEKLLNLCSGPGKLCQAFNITKKQHNKNIGDEIKILDENIKVNIKKANRIGITAAKNLEWRFYIKNNKFVSKR